MKTPVCTWIDGCEEAPVATHLGKTVCKKHSCFLCRPWTPPKEKKK